MKFYFLYINAGHLAVDNGGHNSISKMFDLAKICDTYILKDGDWWGADHMEVNEDTLQIAVELLIQEKIPYRIKHHPEGSDWKGLITDKAKEMCRYGADYNPTYNKLFF